MNWKHCQGSIHCASPKCRVFNRVPSSSGLGRHPLTVKTRVRLPLGLPKHKLWNIYEICLLKYWNKRALLVVWRGDCNWLALSDLIDFLLNPSPGPDSECVEFVESDRLTQAKKGRIRRFHLNTILVSFWSLKTRTAKRWPTMGALRPEFSQFSKALLP